MNERKPSLKDYKFDEKDRVVELTMEATGVSREEAIRGLKELFYRIDYSQKKKRPAKNKKN